MLGEKANSSSNGTFAGYGYQFGYQSISSQETINVISDEGHNSYHDAWNWKSSWVLLVPVIALVVVVGTVGTIDLVWSSSVDIDALSRDIVYPLTLRRVNYKTVDMFKNDKSDFISYKILESYDAIIEPYAPMIVDVAEPSEGSNFYFAVCSKDEPNNCVNGTLKYSEWDDTDTITDAFQPVSVDCQPYESFVVTVIEVDATSKAVVTNSTFRALCLYVRRDIMDLTTDDLSEAMDAMYALWQYSEQDGQSQFGDNYHSALYFSEAHFFNAAQADTDHIHEGLGFIPQHVKFCLIFEKAMQSVNPRVTLPFWEFTKEAPMNISIFDSIMFSADTFGSLHVPADETRGFTYDEDSIEDGVIADGRWSNLQADMNTRMTTIPSSFGYMRSPWNLNPSPYITRFATNNPPLPSCADYELALSYTDPIDFIDAMQKGPHASLHAVIGNVFGCDLLDELYDQGLLRDDLAKSNLCRQWSYFMKDLYRDRFFTPRTDCSHDSKKPLNNFRCGYVCDTTMMQSMIPALEAMMGRDYVPLDGLTNTQWIVIRDFICSGNGYKIVVGAHMDSTSASDPSFWPAHPTQERLVHAQLMSQRYEGEFNWTTDSINQYVCDTSRCYSDAEGTKDYHDVCCYGHNRDDQWLDFITPNRYSYIGPSNLEIMLSTNPNSESYSMPYVFGDFSYAHCAMVEHDIDAVLLAQYNAIQ